IRCFSRRTRPLDTFAWRPPPFVVGDGPEKVRCFAKSRAPFDTQAQTWTPSLRRRAVVRHLTTAIGWRTRDGPGTQQLGASAAKCSRSAPVGSLEGRPTDPMRGSADASTRARVEWPYAMGGARANPVDACPR